MSTVYALYDLNNGFFGTTSDEESLDSIVLSGGSYELIDKTHIKCDLCKAPTKRISNTTCECLKCNKLFSLDVYQGRKTGKNEYSIYQNGHYRFLLFLSDSNTWILTNGQHVDVQEDLDVICALNGIRIQNETRW